PNELPDAGDDADELPMPGDDDLFDELDDEKMGMAKDDAADDGMLMGDAELGEGGSAVYRIDLETLAVTEMFRDAVVVVDAAQAGQNLMLAVASMDSEPSRVVALSLATGATSTVHTADQARVSALNAMSDTLLIGTSRGATVRSIAAATDGVFTSDAFDTTARSTFGTLQLEGSLPDNAAIQVQMRSGSTEKPAGSAWSDWTQAVDVQRFVPSDLSPGRFVQYRVKLTGGLDAQPMLDSVRLAYARPNLPPAVEMVTVEGEATSLTVAQAVKAAIDASQSVSSLRSVSWSASDPNGDTLTYDVLIRKNRRGTFEPLATGLGETSFAWNTAATGEGLFEIKVVARDTPDNPKGQSLRGQQVSEAFRIDLTGPIVSAAGRIDGGVQITVADAAGIVARVDLAVDAKTAIKPVEGQNWRRLVAEDGMADSPVETFVVDLNAISGQDGTLPARIRLRMVDDAGNLAYKSFPLPRAP
ncbi:MAG: hypothetical protein AAGK78_07470, partial [Planctomycetota bacterium]